MVCKVREATVFVDSESHVHFVKQISADDSVDIGFRCDTDASVWYQIIASTEIK